jgi:ABC-type multidrug transport system ATPase subunit
VTVLDCRDVVKSYGTGRRPPLALRGITFQAGSGEIVGVIGPNGAGKTTLFRLVAGDVPVTAGELTVNGARVGSAAARRRVGYAPDPPVAPPELSAVEWLRYLASHRADTGAERERLVRSAVDIGELADFAARRIAGYSRGMAQRLALAAAALTGTRVILLDETLSGVDPLVQRRLRLRVAELAGEGRLVLIASHDLGTVERLATRALILSHGELRADVSMAELLSERVAEVALNGAGLAAVNRVLARFPDATRTGQGVAVPLRNGLSVEAVLATCREERLAVAASRVRYRALEDILLRSVESGEGGS